MTKLEHGDSSNASTQNKLKRSYAFPVFFAGLFKSEIPAKAPLAPLTVPGRCYLCLMLSNTPHTGAKMTTKNR